MKRAFIGRESEVEILEKALQSPNPEMISVIGRRRVGKTFLIRSIYKEEFTVTKTYAEELRNKLSVFRANTKTRKQLFLTLITIFGLHINQHSVGLIDQILEIDDLF